MNISPKVSVPAIVLIGIGAVLLVLGVVLGDDTLTKLGAGVLGAAGIAAPVGYQAPHPVPAQTVDEASDDLLGPKAIKKLTA